MNNSNIKIMALLQDEENTPTDKIQMFKRVAEALEKFHPYICVTLRLGQFEFEGTPSLIGNVIFAHLNSDDWADEVMLKVNGKRYTYTTDPASPLIIC